MDYYLFAAPAEHAEEIGIMPRLTEFLPKKPFPLLGKHVDSAPRAPSLNHIAAIFT